MKTPHPVAAAAAALAATTLLALGSADAQSSKEGGPAVPTIVLVHGAFADASGWQDLVLLLQQDGFKVVAVQNALTSLAADVETTKRVIDAQTGPVVAVGHSYGGAVITGAAAGNPNVKALVYIAAFAPEPGEAVGAFLDKYPSDLGTSLVPDSAGFVYIDVAKYHDVFAGDIAKRQTQAMAVTQKPISSKIFQQSGQEAAWISIPSWYMVAQQDKALSPELQRFYARRINARAIEIKSSHLPFISNPGEVAKLVGEAARTTSGDAALAEKQTHANAPTQFVEANGIRFAYRRLGQVDGIPLIFLQHFTGTMDSWDPAVVDGFARERPIVLFDNAGVSGSGGSTPDSVRAMAEDASRFIAAIGLARVDLLGFSLGGFVAQELATRHVALVRRLILVGTGPEGGDGIKNLGEVLADAQRASPAEPRLPLFFHPTPSSQAAGVAFIERQARRTSDRDPASSEEAVAAQFKTIVDWGSTPGPDAAARTRRITQPVLVVNGKTDVMVPTINSYALFQDLPDARLILYPDSGHGALFQHSADFVRQGLQFLAD